MSGLKEKYKSVVIYYKPILIFFVSVYIFNGLNFIDKNDVIATFCRNK